MMKTDQGYDLIIKSRGGAFTATGDGALVVVSESTSEALSLIVAYPLAVETYIFDFAVNKMIFTTSKISTGVSTAAVFVADCVPG